MQVTISFLPVSLSLVRIPRSRLSKLSHPFLRQILKPNPSFLSITCNELELSVFAEKDVLEDFEPIAKRDRQKKLMSRSRPRGRRRYSEDDDYEYVEISYDTWNVLQIDSHSDALDNSGARIHELSAPLAAAGISILYLSSYMSDFIFVKSTRLQQVVSLMAAAGFDLYSSDTIHLTSRMSPLLSPTTSDESSSVLDLSQELSSSTAAATVAVITRSRSKTDAYMTSMLLGAALNDLSDADSEGEVPTVRSKSHSPSASQVSVLSPDLTCVGLADDSADLWALKIVKLVAFPELIPAHALSRNPRKYSSSSHSSSYSQPQSPSFEFDDTSNGILTPLTDSSDEEDYDEHDQKNCDALDQGPDPLPSPRSAPDLSIVTDIPNAAAACRGNRPHHGPRADSDMKQSPAVDHPTVPFYNFTRTPEGSSLTTDVKLLAALFPPSERYMVICSDELDNVGKGNPVEVCNKVTYDDYDDDDEVDDSRQSEPVQLSGTLKCLQIDLRKYGLDKYGLVNSYSQILQENGINHMYSSTFKTANLLVDKVHARRAQQLLRSC